MQINAITKYVILSGYEDIEIKMTKYDDFPSPKVIYQSVNSVYEFLIGKPEFHGKIKISIETAAGCLVWERPIGESIAGTQLIPTYTCACTQSRSHPKPYCNFCRHFYFRRYSGEPFGPIQLLSVFLIFLVLRFKIIIQMKRAAFFFFYCLLSQ